MTRSGKSRARLIRSSAIVALVSAVLVVPPAVAAGDDGNLEDQYFEAVFADPTNLILNFKLAGAQLENGNIKGAIGTLERVLTLSPGNNQAQFLIASAHLQIGNTAEARRMFTVLIENPDASDVEVAQARATLAGLDQQSRLFNVSGSVSAGAGLADNPEGGSQGNLSQVSGSIVTSSASFTKRALTEEFVTAGANINLQRKLESQNDQSLMISLSTSTKDFAHYHAGDLATVGLSARYLRGVESQFGKGMLNTSISTSRVHIDDKHYLKPDDL
ncbi:MAG: tetratricopeptide repeat protein [Alphaproteobacteria bacterium]|nr:tetratricopeptide repeat protein [Alphaproteobacteria bacterium]